MKFVYEAPVVQVAHMQSVEDWFWLIKAVEDHSPFTDLVCLQARHHRLLSAAELKVDNNDLIVDRSVRMVLQKTYVVWNQSKVGHIVKCNEVFTEQRIPAVLLENVLVSKS